jgi:hypothetical protein
MPSRNLHEEVRTKVGIRAIAIGANATQTGPVQDRNGYEGVELVCSYGAVTTTGTIVTLVVKEGDATGTMTSVADADLIGTETLASLPVQATARTSGTGKNVTKRVGYKGSKRYVQALMVSTGTTSVGVCDAVWLMHSPRIGPQTNP